MKAGNRKAAVPDRGGWLAGAPGAGPYLPWLQEAGSLTGRIIRFCPAHAPFGIRVLRRGDARPQLDEYTVIGVPPSRSVRTREVVLLSGNAPLVYAHSVAALEHLRHPWRLMESVGGRALGTVLFNDPCIVRGPLYFRHLDARHRLYHRALSWSAVRPRRLWARRAVFSIGACPLLVTEIFLPSIIDLRA